MLQTDVKLSMLCCSIYKEGGREGGTDRRKGESLPLSYLNGRKTSEEEVTADVVEIARN
jgi:hypothetical protein